MVAGEASPIPTGQAVPPNVPVRVVVDGGAVNGSIAVTAAAVLVAAIAALVYILGHVNLQGRPVPDVRRNLQDAPYPVILEDLVSKLRALSSELQGHGH